ncbi:MAG: cysteine--tRNA ligase [Candidatus Moranbacteria bacterium]|nr:cysteine--tRNA ligase [Candidatus Moranbacteria bacterium]
MLLLYNSLTRRKQIFKPIKGKTVAIYSCGPTVYDYAHIGNFRSYIAWDLLVRYLKYLGRKTAVVKNITDVGHFTNDDEDRGEDKFDKAARREKKNPLDIAKFYSRIFVKEEKKLNILPPDFRPCATKEIKTMQKIIKGLLKKGYAYNAKDGVYFDISRFKNYGRLSGNTLKEILSGARVKINPNKKHPADFSLWKKLVGKNRRHALHWPSPWGEGFPGWHIECSAMALRYLGKNIDIHTGGQDNKFPHHESEIAQSEAYTGKPFSQFWLHTGLMDVDGKKMSKTLQNFYTLQNIVDKGFNPLAFRFWVLSSHYRSPLNFTWRGLGEAADNWMKIVEFIRDNKFVNKIDKIYAAQKEKQFISALDDDLNTPKAVALLLQAIKDANKNAKKMPTAAYLIKKWDRVLGILPAKIEKPKKLVIPAKVKKLLAERQKARENKNFLLADKLRKKIKKLGFLIADKLNGNYQIKKKQSPET